MQSSKIWKNQLRNPKYIMRKGISQIIAKLEEVAVNTWTEKGKPSAFLEMGKRN